MRCQAPDLQLSIFMLQIKAYLIELCHVLVDGPVFNWLNITFVLLFWNVTVLMVAYYFVYQFHFAICKSNRKCKYDLQIDKATHKKTIDRSFRMLVNIFAKPNVIEQQKKTHSLFGVYLVTFSHTCQSDTVKDSDVFSDRYAFGTDDTIDRCV